VPIGHFSIPGTCLKQFAFDVINGSDTVDNVVTKAGGVPDFSQNYVSLCGTIFAGYSAIDSADLISYICAVTIQHLKMYIGNKYVLNVDNPDGRIEIPAVLDQFRKYA